MPRALKVYGTMLMLRRGQARCVVAAPNLRAAAKAFDCSYYHASQYAAVTGNAKEIEAATSQPGVLFVETKAWTNDYAALCVDCGFDYVQASDEVCPACADKRRAALVDAEVDRLADMTQDDVRTK